MLYQFHANLSHSCIPFAVPTSSSCSHQPNNSARFQGNYASREDGEILLAKHNCFSISPSFSPSGPPKTQIVKGRTQVVTMEQNPFEIPSCAMQWSEQDKKLPSALPSAALLCLPSQTAPSETNQKQIVEKQKPRLWLPLVQAGQARALRWGLCPVQPWLSSPRSLSPSQ